MTHVAFDSAADEIEERNGGQTLTTLTTILDRTVSLAPGSVMPSDLRGHTVVCRYALVNGVATDRSAP